MHASLFLALAYLKPKRSLLSAINVLAVLGTLLGVAVLIIVISVMNGFDSMWREKILSFHPHVTLYSPFERLEEDDPLFREVAALPGVSEVAPFIQSLVVAQNGDWIDAPVLRGIDPELDFLYRKLLANPTNRVDGSLEFGEEECLLGVDLARKLGVRAGDRITVFSPATFAREQEIVLPKEIRVAGLFAVGMWQIDQGYMVTTLETARDITHVDTGVDGMQVLSDDLWNADALAKTVGQVAGPRYHTLSWMQMNQQLFDALLVEKRMMFFLLAVISIVASFLVSCTLIMVSVQKTKEIGLLKALGWRNGTIMGAFMWYGLIQGLMGIVLGTGTGLLVLHYRQNILNGMSKLANMELLPPELYFLNELPSRTEASDVLMIVGLVLLLCLTGGSLPAWLAARRPPVEALRHD